MKCCQAPNLVVDEESLQQVCTNCGTVTQPAEFVNEPNSTSFTEPATFNRFRAFKKDGLIFDPHRQKLLNKFTIMCHNYKLTKTHQEIIWNRYLDIVHTKNLKYEHLTFQTLFGLLSNSLIR